jgi:hypothetical protein
MGRCAALAYRPLMFVDSHLLVGALLGASQDLVPNKVNINNRL